MTRFRAFLPAYGPRIAMFSALQFFVLTLLAMLFYPGGTTIDPAATRYLFFQNFFSELGLTVVYDGTPNPVSALLFFTTLTLAGLGLVVFFLTLPAFFAGRGPKAIGYIGSFFGLIAGICFVGVAFTPANLALRGHSLFVLGAFLSFFIAVLFYAVAVPFNPDYPNRYALVYLIFALLLAGYIYLLFNGPVPGSETGRIIQATGQKIIGYATLVVTFIQGYGLEKMRGPVRVAALASNAGPHYRTGSQE